MDGIALLDRARQAGLTVSRAGEQLIVRGPRRLALLAEELLAAKTVILPLLDGFEGAVTWRLAVMRPQVPPRGGIPFLMARPKALGNDAPGACLSCGDPMAGGRYRCPPCGEAARRVLAEVRENVD